MVAPRASDWDHGPVEWLSLRSWSTVLHGGQWPCAMVVRDWPFFMLSFMHHFRQSFQCNRVNLCKLVAAA